MRFPDNWFDLGNYGAPYERWFSNEQTNVGIDMSATAVAVSVSANCLYTIGPQQTVVARAAVSIDGYQSIRWVLTAATPDGPIAGAIVTVTRGIYCYRIYMIAHALEMIQQQLPTFDLMLQTIRFSSRTAPPESPVPTTPPTNSTAGWT